MNATTGLEGCLSFINTQLRNGLPASRSNKIRQTKVVTLSRQAGCGAAAVALNLAKHLQARTPDHEPPWTVFDRNLVERVLEEHHLPQRLAKFMPESWTSEIADTLDELFGLHPPSWILVRQTAETILRLAMLGNVIIIGRGANIVTARLAAAFHVRLVAPLERRIIHMQESHDLDRRAALDFIRNEDKGRKRY